MRKNKWLLALLAASASLVSVTHNGVTYTLEAGQSVLTIDSAPSGTPRQRYLLSFSDTLTRLYCKARPFV